MQKYDSDSGSQIDTMHIPVKQHQRRINPCKERRYNLHAPIQPLIHVT